MIEDGCTIVWNEVDSDGGTPVDGFDVFYHIVGSDKWTKANDELILVKQFKLANLTVGETYEFRIEAVNGAGMRSEPSPVSETLTLSAPMSKSYRLSLAVFA